MTLYFKHKVESRVQSLSALKSYPDSTKVRFSLFHLRISKQPFLQENTLERCKVERHSLKVLRRNTTKAEQIQLYPFTSKKIEFSGKK